MSGKGLRGKRGCEPVEEMVYLSPTLWAHTLYRDVLSTSWKGAGSIWHPEKLIGLFSSSSSRTVSSYKNIAPPTKVSVHLTAIPTSGVCVSVIDGSCGKNNAQVTWPVIILNTIMVFIHKVHSTHTHIHIIFISSCYVNTEWPPHIGHSCIVYTHSILQTHI